MFTAPNVASLRAVKAERQGSRFDDMFIGMHLAQAQRLLYGSEKPQATAVILQLAHRPDPGGEGAPRELLATTLNRWRYRTSGPQSVLRPGGRMFAAIFGFMAVIGAIVLFTVGNTMSMAVMERTAEIGTLRAMGLRRSGIRRLFMGEGFLLGVIGAAAGVAVALCVAWLINHAGLTWLPPGQVDPVPLTVRVWGRCDDARHGRRAHDGR